MKKIMSIVVSLITLVLILTACGSKNNYADDAFIQDLSRGLEERWDLSKSNDKDSKENNAKLDATELDRISKYSEKKFKNTKLQEQAIAYINAVKSQKDSLKYYGSEEYVEKWTEAANKRFAILIKINKIKKLDISGKYKDDWEGVKGSGKVAITKNKQKEKVDNLIKGITFKAKPKEYADDEYTTYEAIVENNTGYNMKSFVANIKLLDKDGTTADTTSVSTDNWDNGDKVKLSFETDAKVDKIEIHRDYIEFAN